MKTQNKPGAVNGGTALWFQIEHPWPAVTDPERWVELRMQQRYS
jgi:hypothetical protein